MRELQGDIDLLQKVFATDRGEDHNGTLIVRNEQASAVYSTQLIADILKENANKRFETRTAIPGHVQQGFTPSANDRVMAVKFSLKPWNLLKQEMGVMVNTIVNSLMKKSVNILKLSLVSMEMLLNSHVSNICMIMKLMLP